MKIIGIFSSPQSNGNTAILVKNCLNATQRLGAEIELVDLAKENLMFCKGCMMCMKTGKCPLPDNLEIIKQKMAGADGLILGSPVYALSTNAIMKNFYDRIGMFNAYTSLYGNKYIIGIATAGKFGTKRVVKLLTDIVLGVFHHGTIVGTIPFARGWNRIEAYPQIIRKAELLGEKMVLMIRNQTHRKFQKLGLRLLQKVIIRRIFIQNILKNKNDEMKGVYEYLIQENIIKRTIPA